MNAQVKAQPTEVEQQLEALLGELDCAEKALLVEAIGKARYRASGPGRIDEIALVREFLKAEDTPGGFRFDIPRTMPAMIKPYVGAAEIHLPEAGLDHPLAEVMHQRKSVRDFQRRALDLQSLSALLNTAYGIKGHIQAYRQKRFPTRLLPSSGGLQPVEVYVVINEVDGASPGLYHFNPERQSLQQVDIGLMRRSLVKACAFQDWIGEAPIVLALTCDLDKLIWKYRRRAYKMAHIDVGIVAQNLHLTAQAMGLGSCMLAGFSEDALHRMLNVDGEREFVALMLAVGHPID